MKNVLVLIPLYCHVKRGLFVILDGRLENVCLSNFEFNLDFALSSLALPVLTSLMT